MAILRMTAVKAETGHRSHASIYNAIKAGLFTKPVPIGERAVGWPDDEVQAICLARIAGSTNEEIRSLVDALHAKRAERLAVLMAKGVA
jgi:prophage regulatory protein